MPKNIKYRTNLPITPTTKPNGSDVAAVAVACVDIAQDSLLSPAAVISALRCALDLYERNAEAKGFDVETVVKCEELGEQVARTMLEIGNADDQGVVIRTPELSGLLGPDGSPL